MFIDSKRFAGNGGLIDLKESIFGNDTAISGDDSTLRLSVICQDPKSPFADLFDLKDITRNDFGGFNFLQLAVTENSSLESKSLLQFFDNRTSLVFLDETDKGVKKE
jgi:hypothetical protein